MRLMAFLFFLFVQLCFQPSLYCEEGVKTQPYFPLEEKVSEEEKPDRFTSELVNMLTTLGIFIGALIALSWVLKKLMSQRVEQVNQHSNIKIVERRTLSPKSNIYLLDILGKTLVIAETPAGITHLSTIDGTIDDQEEEAPTTHDTRTQT